MLSHRRHSPVMRLCARQLVFLAALGGCFTATAQTGGSSGSGGSVSTLSEEITVTARRREESLDELPLSVTAFTGATLEARGVERIGDLGHLSPNVTFQNNPSFGGSSNVASIYIRGIGAKEFTPTTDPGVGLYVDGVYIARSVGAILNLLDFERVEILRGPQGTLFGRNTIGGAVSITAAKPHDEFAANVAVTIGSDSRTDLKGSVNVPLSDHLFAKLTAASFNQDGYVKRLDGVELGEDDTNTARLDVRWLPSDRVTVDWSLDWSKDDETGPALSLVDIRFGPVTIDPSTPPFVFFNNVAATLGGAVPNPLPPGPPPPECATPAAPLSSNPFCYDYRYVTGVNGPNAGTAPAFSEATIWGTALNVAWDITDQLQLRSITAYRSLESEFSRDGDHSPLTISQFYDYVDQEQLSQELQLLGQSFDERLTWILGLYWFQEDGLNINELDFLISSFRSGGYFDNSSQAIFAQGTFDVTERLHLTAGVRWTEDEKKFLPDQEIYTLNPAMAGFLSPPQQFIFTPGTPILPAVEKTLKESQATPMVNLSFDWNDALMTYVSYSEGFKSGGFTQRVLPPLLPGITCSPVPEDCIPGFDPEFVTVYEAGFRYVSADSKVRVSGAAYHTDYKDLQISVFTSVAPVYRNAAGASIDGFELEGQFALGGSTFFEASVGYTDAGYDAIDPSTRVSITAELERISKWSLNAGLTHDWFAGNYVVTPRVDWSYRSKLYNDAFNAPQLAQDDYQLVNASVALRDPDKGWSLTLGATNLTDEKYLVSGVFGDAFSSYEGLYDRGRQYYLRVSWSL
ncbi:MAG: TonB-dependent receptor [Gammaproteobacteria bacterium]|nr:TonB-dependent receptor [Gammaproteobacteria bacterium]